LRQTLSFLKRLQAAAAIVEKLKKKNILCYATAPDRVRLVVHLDITEEMVNKTIEVIKGI
jgi:threonine aldolase